MRIVRSFVHLRSLRLWFDVLILFQKIIAWPFAERKKKFRFRSQPLIDRLLYGQSKWNLCVLYQSQTYTRTERERKTRRRKLKLAKGRVVSFLETRDEWDTQRIDHMAKLEFSNVFAIFLCENTHKALDCMRFISKQAFLICFDEHEQHEYVHLNVYRVLVSSEFRIWFWAS